MARKKQEDVKPGSPAWMATFSDLMNLLLCFFVLLFSMSTVDQEKFELVIASLQSSFSILPAGGSAVGDGSMIGAGISQLEDLDIFYKQSNSPNSVESENDSEEDLKEQYQAEAQAESEQMVDQIETLLQQNGISDQVRVDATAQYARLTLNGALLFDSGQAEIREDALPLMQKLCIIIESYADNQIGIEGHTDNVPMSSDRYEDNDVLSAYRALSVKTYFVENAIISPGIIRATSCGEYTPIADNSTSEGRAMNRRVEIKIYNSFSSY